MTPTAGPPLTLTGGLSPQTALGVVVARGISLTAATSTLDTAIDELVQVRQRGDFPPAELKAGVRALLRFGGYKPSGRGKPASEYLAGAARKGAFPRLSPLVDTANRYSLLTGLPISLVDLDLAAPQGEPLVARLGHEGERYVFNQSGQDINIAGLLVLAREGGDAFANPVKDSLATRTHDGTKNALAVIYGTTAVATADIIERMAAQLGAEFARHAGATGISSVVLTAAPPVA